ncbi:MAG: C4-type zinc ribbon domain-containing protein [Armatimonadota bacterium]|nr:C4-type zinc ribbon domain-containing protein [Armatimonadota bacterium]
MSGCKVFHDFGGVTTPIVMEDLDRLASLQELDSRIDHLEQVRRSLDDGTSLRTSLDEAKTRLVQMREQLRGKQARLRALELQLESIVQKQKKLEQDLYSGRITNPKELAGLQGEVEALGRMKDRLEDEILVLLDETEGFLRDVAQLEAEVAQRERALEEYLEDYRSRIREVEGSLGLLRRRREELISQIDPELLEKYEYLRERKGGKAVAFVAGEVCGGCNVALPAGILSKVREKETLVTCEECGRILYLKMG